MTTETFADAFKKNVSNTMKLFQDSTTAIIDVQAKQVEFASNLYTQALDTFESINKNNLGNSFDSPEKMIEIIKKNFESISNLSKSTLKTALELGNRTFSTAFSKQVIDKISETYSKQAEEIAVFNQKYFDIMSKKFDTTAPFFNYSLMEKLKKDFDANIEFSKEQLHSIIDSYNKITNPSFESNKFFLNEISKQIDTMVDTNLRLWSELMSEFNFKTTETSNTNTNFKKTRSNSESKIQTAS
jgi:hypothetical protein